MRHVPGVNVELCEGPRASFEVDRDGVRIFSKLRKGRLPDFQRVVDEVGWGIILSSLPQPGAIALSPCSSWSTIILRLFTATRGWR